MFVIYETSSIKYAREYEVYIVDHFAICRSDFTSHNVNSGGSGNFSELPPYYVYLAVANE
jgi:hypothetical protein